MTETKEVVCPSHMSHECQRAKVLQRKGKQWSEGDRGKQGGHPPYLWAPSHMEQRRKTASDGHGRRVFREPPYFRGEAVIRKSFRR